MTPSGVKKFGHKAQSTKGSNHPSDILPGLEAVDKQGGSHPPAAPAPGGSDKHIKSVKRGDGTETLQGTKVVHKQGSIPKAPGSPPKNYPKEIRQHSGLKAPKSGKQPK